MEEIERYLLEEEKILWKYVETKNLLKIPILKIVIGIILTISLSILFNLLYYILIQDPIAVLISILSLSIASFVIFGIFLIIPGILKYLKIMDNLKTTSKNLMKYSEISIITDKRLIQKSYNVFEIDYVKNPITNLEDFEINRDIVFVNLPSIHVVSIEALESFYQVAFKNRDDDEQYIPLLFTIPLENISEFINILEEEIPLKRKKRLGNYLINYYKN
ncbi:MAG: hypothetical protein ACFFBP_03410 [Promethearchaeota archaeon]